MTEFHLFQTIAATPGKNDKIRLLKENETGELKKLLWLTYNRFITYRIKQIDFPDKYNSLQPNIVPELEELLLLLARHETGSKEARNMIRRLLGKCTEENAQWVTKIITRDLKIGIDESSINKAFPGLIPVFDVQLAHPIYSGGKNPVNRWPTLIYPRIVEEKLDGCRAVCIVKDGKASFFSREGHEFDNCEVLGREVLKLMPGTSFVLDGEIIAKKFNPNNKTFLKTKDGNWPYEGGKALLKSGDTTEAEVKEFLGYYCWDLIDLDFFESQGKEGRPVPLSERRLRLAALFERCESTFNNLFLVPNAMARTEAEVKELFARVRAKGGQKYSCLNAKGQTVEYSVGAGEGVMVKDPTRPYEFKRSDGLLKVKEFYTCDLRIIGAYEGKLGTKFEGMLGGLILGSDDGVVNTDCGSGFDDEQRFDLWRSYQRGELAGQIAEVSYQERTVDGSLRFPVFQRLRQDKTTTNVE